MRLFSTTSKDVLHVFSDLKGQTKVFNNNALCNRTVQHWYLEFKRASSDLRDVY